MFKITKRLPGYMYLQKLTVATAIVEYVIPTFANIAAYVREALATIRARTRLAHVDDVLAERSCVAGFASAPKRDRSSSFELLTYAAI